MNRNFLIFFLVFSGLLRIHAQVNVFFEDFATGMLPAGWSQVDSIGNGFIWRFDNPGNRDFYSSSNGGFAVCDNEVLSQNNDYDAWLFSPLLDVSYAAEYYLSFEQYYKDATAEGDKASVYISNDGGSSWEQIHSIDEDKGSASHPDTAIIDISAYTNGKEAIQIAFRYTDDTEAYFWMIDDVRLYIQGGEELRLQTNTQQSCGEDIKLNALGAGFSMYRWFRNGAEIFGANQSFFEASQSGSYFVSAFDGMQIVYSDTFDVEVIPTPQKPTILQTGNNPVCFGDSLILKAESNSGVNYQWLNGGDIPGKLSDSLVVETSGTYAVKVFWDSRCPVVSDYSSVSVNTSLIKPDILVSQPVICADDVELNSVYAANYYQWFYNDIPIIGAENSSLKVFEQGYYSLETSNSCEKDTSDKVFISKNTMPKVSGITPSNTEVCSGDSIIFIAPADTGFITYEWRNATDYTLLGTDDTLVLKQPGEYDVELVAQRSGCQSISAPVFVVVHKAIPALKLANVGSLTYCEAAGASVEIGEEDYLNIGTEYTGQYQWYQNGELLVNEVNPSIVVTDNIASSGEYYLKIDNNCQSRLTDTLTVEVTHAARAMLIDVENSKICANRDSVLVEAQLDDNADFTYQWEFYTMGSWDPILADDDSLFVKDQGQYRLKTTTACGENFSEFEIFEMDSLLIQIELSAGMSGLEFCKGQGVSLISSSYTNLSGGNFKWYQNNSNSPLEGENGTEILTEETGDYYLEISNVCNTLYSDTLSIVVNDVPDLPSFIQFDSIACGGDFATLEVSQEVGLTYQWYAKDTSAWQAISGAISNLVEVEGAKYYRVKASNLKNCFSYSEAKFVQAPESISNVQFNQKQIDICYGDDVVLEINQFLKPDNTYQWYRQALGSDILVALNTTKLNVSTQGSYFVKVGNACSFGYSDTAEVKVYQTPLAPVIEAEGLPVLCPSADVKLFAKIDTQYTALLWQGNFGLYIGDTLILSSPDTITVKAFNKNVGACYSSGSEEYNVVTGEQILTNIKVSKEAVCPNDSVVIYVPSQEGMIYSWYRNNVLIPEAKENFYFAKQSGDFKVVITSVCGVTDSAKVSLSESELPNNIAMVLNDNEFCEGDNIVAQANANPLQYSISWLLNNQLIIGQADSVLYYSTSDLSPGMHSVSMYIKDEYSCFVGANPVIIKVNQLPDSPLIISEASVICDGQEILLSTDYTHGNQIALQWFKNDIAVGSAVGQSLLVNEAAEYYLMAKTADNCKTASNHISLPLSSHQAIQDLQIAPLGKLSICDGLSATLVAPEYTMSSYLWFKDGVHLSSYPIDMDTINCTETGEYTLTVSNECGSVSSNALKVHYLGPEMESPEISFSASVVCDGKPVYLSIPAQYDSYQWYRNGTIIPNAESYEQIVFTEGDYAVRVTSACGSKLSNVLSLVKGSGELPVISDVTVENSGYLCDGNALSLSVASNFELNYQWSSRNSIGEWEQISNANDSILWVQQEGAYRLKASNACGVSFSEVIEVFKQEEVSIVELSGYSSDALCAGDSLLLQVNPAGGWKDYYQTLWYKNGILWKQSYLDEIYVYDKGYYQVELTNACGVEASNTLQVIAGIGEKPMLSEVIISSGLDELCEGEFAELVIMPQAGISYNWQYYDGENPWITVEVGSDKLIVGNSGGYRVKAIASGGCVSYSNTVNISQVKALDNSPILELDGEPSVFCEGGQVEVEITNNTDLGSVNYSANWYRNDTLLPYNNLKSIIVGTPGAYKVQVKNICSATTSNVVQLTYKKPPAKPQIIVDGPVSICEAGITNLSAKGESGFEYAFYSNGQFADLPSSLGLSNLPEEMPNGFQKLVTGLSFENASGFMGKSASFYLAISSPEGCINTSEVITIRHDEMPDKPFIIEAGISDDGKPLLSVLNKQDGVVYAWYNEYNSQVDSGEVMVTEQSGKYKLIAENSCGIAVSYAYFIEVGLEGAESGEITIMPNPASDFLQILSSEEIVKLEIKNLLGQVAVEVVSPEGAIDVSGLATGVYILNVQLQSGGSASFKFIKTSNY